MKSAIYTDTNSTVKVLSTSRKSVKLNSWLVILGDAGSGKSFLLDRLLESLEGKKTEESDNGEDERGELSNVKKNKTSYIFVQLGKLFSTGRISITQVMRSIIEEILPGQHIPGSATGKQKMLKEALMYAGKTSRKVILLIDNAHYLDQRMLRDLKDIHELSYGDLDSLFSIIMFARPEYRFASLLNAPEFDIQTQRVYIQNLPKPDILEFSKQAFGLRFSSGKDGERAKSLFLTHVYPLNPGGIKALVNRMYLTVNKFDGLVTTDRISQVVNTDMLSTLKKYRISIGEVRKAVANSAGKNLTDDQISKALDGDSTSRKHEIIREQAMNLLRKKADNGNLFV
ncbi:AAA domain protein [Leptospira interrogans str. FPW2026]|uniref:ATP-binding protein n=1 Tax=Leptospira interrogans TaxID=173 RepID=UPI00027848C4|nr:ATP-binding protein [Leptospira interrogans]EJP16931.1 AAA domain protein [Leptospira interrogans str. FPW2026]